MLAPAMAWDPAQYQKFRSERAQPFRDLLALVQPRPRMRVVDLGCGPGELTRDLHQTLGAAQTLGIDSSDSMLLRAAEHAREGLRFEKGEIERFHQPGSVARFDLIFSNAALHWVARHGQLLQQLTAQLAPGGQIAIQMPRNEAHPSHLAAQETASEPRFRRLLHGYLRQSPVLEPAQYAAWLFKLGFVEQHVRVQIYPHLLGSRDEVVEWTRGTLLTDYEARLSAPDFARFLARYREVLLPQLEDARPFLFTFERLFVWGRLAGQGRT